MTWEYGVYWLCIAIGIFVVVGLPGVLKTFSDNKVKVAEANRRTEEVRTERRKIDVDHEKWLVERART